MCNQLHRVDEHPEGEYWAAANNGDEEENKDEGNQSAREIDHVIKCRLILELNLAKELTLHFRTERNLLAVLILEELRAPEGDRDLVLDTKVSHIIEY